MTPSEYIQLRAFARVDGLRLFLLWLVGFVCYIGSLHSPGYGLLATVFTLAIPFFAYRLLRRFRDNCLNGTISFSRAWGYVILMFFYAGLLFAVAQFVYFTYIDKGFFASAMMQMLNDPQSAEAFRQMGFADTLKEAVHLLSVMRPIDLVLNILFSNMIVGAIIGLPLAAFAKRAPANSQL